MRKDGSGDQSARLLYFKNNDDEDNLGRKVADKTAPLERRFQIEDDAKN